MNGMLRWKFSNHAISTADSGVSYATKEVLQHNRDHLQTNLFTITNAIPNSWKLTDQVIDQVRRSRTNHCV